MERYIDTTCGRHSGLFKDTQLKHELCGLFKRYFCLPYNIIDQEGSSEIETSMPTSYMSGECNLEGLCPNTLMSPLGWSHYSLVAIQVHFTLCLPPDLQQQHHLLLATNLTELNALKHVHLCACTYVIFYRIRDFCYFMYIMSLYIQVCVLNCKHMNTHTHRESCIHLMYKPPDHLSLVQNTKEAYTWTVSGLFTFISATYSSARTLSKALWPYTFKSLSETHVHMSAKCRNRLYPLHM